MKTKTTMAVAGAMLVLAAVGTVWAEEAQPAGKAAAEQAVKKQTLCPVMGGEINKALFVDYEGKRVYVCCKMCVAEMKKDPAKYIKKLEAEGITLDKTPKAATPDAPAATPTPEKK